MFINIVRLDYYGITTLEGFSLTHHSGAFIELADDKYHIIRDVYLKYRERKIKDGKAFGAAIWDAIPEMMEKTGLSQSELSKEISKLSLDLFLQYPNLYFKSVIPAWISFWKIALYWNPNKIKSNFIKVILKDIAFIQKYFLLLMKFLFLIFAVKYIVSIIQYRKIENEFYFLIIGIVIIESILQALVESGENARYSIPFQPLIITFVILQSINIIKGKITAFKFLI